MHLLIISVMCCGILLAQENRKEERCRKDVPLSVREVLIDVLNDFCTTAGGRKLNINNYDCNLGRKASKGRQIEKAETDPYTYFDGQSSFEFDWQKSLSEAVKVADKEGTLVLTNPVAVMCALGKKVGCSIKLSTSNETGIHKLNLHCNYRMLHLPA
uniref:SCP domain-containing protein n=1 Tax=Haemonchus contortus TaxID=6289 RepID=A0A6F7Q4W8_HAECO|nr:unnamed protein product [Haemonchus contortus]